MRNLSVFQNFVNSEVKINEVYLHNLEDIELRLLEHIIDGSTSEDYQKMYSVFLRRKKKVCTKYRKIEWKFWKETIWSGGLSGNNCDKG